MTEPTNSGSEWQDVSTPAGQTPNVPPVTDASGYPPPSQSYPPPPQSYPPPPQGYAPQAAGLSANAAAAISYITFIPAVVFLVLEPYKRIPFVRFHSIQSIGLSLVSFIIGRILNIFFFSAVVGGGWAFAALVHTLINLALFVLWLVCVISAAQGKWFKIPVLGDMALKMSQNP